MIFNGGTYEIDEDTLFGEGGPSLDSLLDLEDSQEIREKHQALVDRVKFIITTLPPREADFVELYYFKKLKQTDISNIFQVSQPTVCYRLQRATARIQFLLKLPPIDIEDLKIGLRKYLKDQLDADIMTEMYKTTCQSEVAKILNVSQGLVRHRFMRSLKRLEKNPEASDFYQIFYINFKQPKCPEGSSENSK